MQPASLKHPDELTSFAKPGNRANLTINYNPRKKGDEYLLVVSGVRDTGGYGELAHLHLPESVFQTFRSKIPVSMAKGQRKSLDLDNIGQIQEQLLIDWVVSPDENVAPFA